MSACILVGYFVKPNEQAAGFIERLFHPRFVNRSMIVLVLLATAALAPRLQSGLDPEVWRGQRGGEGGTGDEAMFIGLARSLAGVTSVALLIGALLFDLATPVSINGTVLLPLALLWAVRAGNRRLMLWLIPLTVVVPLVALAKASGPPELETYMLVNRLISALASSTLALVLYWTITRAAHDPDPIVRPQPVTSPAGSENGARSVNEPPRALL
jgi:hypothetical protein